MNPLTWIPVSWVPGLLLVVLVTEVAWIVLVAAARAWQADEPPAGPPAPSGWAPGQPLEWACLRRPVVTTKAPDGVWLASWCRGACEHFEAPHVRAPAPARLELLAPPLPLTARCRWESPSPATQELEVIRS